MGKGKRKRKIFWFAPSKEKVKWETKRGNKKERKGQKIEFWFVWREEKGKGETLQKGSGKWKGEQFWFKVNEKEIWKMDTKGETERKRLD